MRMKSSLGIEAIATVQMMIKVVQPCGPLRWVA
jgi:hypothetical protein